MIVATLPRRCQGVSPGACRIVKLNGRIMARPSADGLATRLPDHPAGMATIAWLRRFDERSLIHPRSAWVDGSMTTTT
jgi:hypothetical protein